MKNTLQFQFFFILLTFALFPSFGQAQTQIGNDIDGEAPNNWSGKSVSMPNATTIAIGAESNDGIASGAGHVRVFDWNGNAWVQRGTDIDGRSSFDKCGTIVSMPDENTVAIGVPGGAQGSNPYGRVEVHTWNGNSWAQKGTDILGISSGERFGFALSMPSANTLAIGAQGGSAFPVNPNGKVLIYEWNGTNWVQKGSTLIGENSDDNFGYAVSMPDDNTVAVSAPLNDSNGSSSGHVRIYSFDGTSWIQKGGDINGEAANDKSGWSISMPNANHIAIGAPFNGGGGFQNGHVRIYEWSGTSWTQKGMDIDGASIADQSGYSVAMPTNDLVAIGSPFNDDFAPLAGQVNVFQWTGVSWQKFGTSINGEAQDDESGNAISMGDGNTLAIGAYENEGNGNSAGHVRVFSLNNANTLKENLIQNFEIFPNPSYGVFTVQVEAPNKEINMILRDVTRHEVFSKSFQNSYLETWEMQLPSGIYLLELTDSKEILTTKRIIIQ